ncbi:MAG: hypothetical protein GY722_12315 [bacterium]|nr:hypothetical protein [bacterium]
MTTHHAIYTRKVTVPGPAITALTSVASGALINVAGEEAIDCVYGDCGDLSLREAAGDAVEGGFPGGTGWLLGRATATSLGSEKPYVGLWSLATDHSTSAAAETVISQLQERLIRALGAWILNGMQQ